MSQPLERVADQLVSEDNLPRYDLDGMDSDRCAALHNAILEHGWTASGRTTEDFLSHTRTWWQVHGEAPEASRLHISLRTFLKNARIVPRECQPETSFFYNVGGLHHPSSFFTGPGSSMFEDTDMILTLYNSHEKLAGTPDGLLYEQLNHSAIMHFDIEDDLVLEFEKWDKLESILTVWIEMIQRGKVVALPANVGRQEYKPSPEGGFSLIEGPHRDPLTGARRIYEELSPWTVQPWTSKDLEESLSTWDSFVGAVEQKMGLEAMALPAVGLYDSATLDAARVPEGFAREFLSKARRPRFENVSPGLRLSTPAEFTAQPFVEMDLDPANVDDDEILPILLFRNEATVDSQALDFQCPGHARGDIPRVCQVGLWLDRCHRMSHTPFEDGCRLVLPNSLEDGLAKQSDMSPVNRLDGLLQIVTNPYNERHPFQLQAFLEMGTMNLHQDYWKVDSQGVAGGIGVWSDADTEERWQSYLVPVGPGRFW